MATKTPSEKTTYRRKLNNLTPQELAYVVGQALRFKCFDMEYNWPSNATITNLSANEPVVISNLVGQVFIEQAGVSRSFVPQNGSEFIQAMIKEIGAVEITHFGVSEDPAVKLKPKVRVVARDSKRYDIMYAYESENLDELPLLLATALVRVRVGTMMTLPMGLKGSYPPAPKK